MECTGPANPAIPYILNKCSSGIRRRPERTLLKHDISFDEAATVFLDPDALDGPDEVHSGGGAAFSTIRPIGRRSSADGGVYRSGEPAMRKRSVSSARGARVGA